MTLYVKNTKEMRSETLTSMCSGMDADVETVDV